ncbi:glycosyltransferase family 39 protein [Sphingobacterium siyangense]|uniref:glycosyltransferase family 39 protein n=1 Tax=Sphingobacterium TaxID=28453 RepID=UPI000957D3AD|nr:MULTISPECIES: glycosyltransferase family 39 protein [Sphingobacterium]APU98697.1 glycosyl transferase [Sphingobacterium sp. B29]UQA74317.1 glycosyltransferase family 39 protein [Sphingobacterium siyangense]
MALKNRIILISLIIFKFIMQYQLISPTYELQRDEFLHVDQANHLAWGYLSVPPITSLISYLIKILGNSVFWIKFFPALFGALTILIVWKTIESLKGNLFAQLFGSCCIMFSVLFRLNGLYQPNSFDVLCWTSIYYCIIKYLNNKQSKWLFYMAIVFALGFLNKYNIVFLILGLIPAVALVPERKIFTEKKLYYGILIALLIILPNLVWQYRNNFPVFVHFKELQDTQLVHVNRWSFVRSQFLFFFGTFPVLILGLYALLKYPAFKTYRLFFYSFFITLGIFLFLRAKDYYAIGLYPIYFAFGAVYISSLLENKTGQILKPILIVLTAILFLPVYNIAFPNRNPAYFVNHPDKYRKYGMLTWEDGKEHPLPQDFADMLGWQELARKVDSLYDQIPRSENTLVLCDNYGQAGAINYYSKRGIKAVSFNADYINWFDLNKAYSNVIRIKNRWERERELAATSPFFNKSMLADSITNTYAREYGTVIFTFIHAKININERISEEIASEKTAKKLPL